MIDISGPNLSLKQQTHAPEWWREGALFSAEFNNNRYMANGAFVPVGDILNTTRASSGYAPGANGHLIPFGPNAPRRTNKGLLIEGASTNICSYSEPYSDISFFGPGHSNTHSTRVDVDWLGIFTKAVRMNGASAESIHIFSRRCCNRWRA